MSENPVHNPSDKELITRILRGDQPAFGLIIKNTEKLVAQIVFKMIPIPEDRKDLAQDIYLKVFHNLPGFKFQSKLSTWIARIAYNTCISWNEKKKLVLTGDLIDQQDLLEEKDSSDGWPAGNGTPETAIFQKQLSGILTKEIDRLPPVYQTLICLFHQESMTYAELSQITGLPEGTVKSSLFRARKLLKENLLLKYQKEAL